MATLIGFSAQNRDSILVEESVDDVRNALLPTALTADGFCHLTRIPKSLEVTTQPVPVFVNPARIAFIHENAE